MLSTESRPGVLKHPDVQRGLHQPEVKKQPHTVRKIIAGITAGAMITGAGIAYDQATKNGWFDNNNGGIVPGTTDTDSSESTETSTETTLPTEITSESIIIPTTKLTTETITESTTEITTTQSTEVTTETTTEATMPTTRETTVKPTTTSTTTETTTPTTKPTTEATTTPTTTSTTETTTPPTSSELEGVLTERLQFTEDLLNLYDKSSKEYAPASNKIKDFIDREQIINYGKGGEYLVRAGDIVEFENGTPAVALINCPNNVISGFKKAINIMESYDSNYLKTLTDNGLKAFMPYYFDSNFGDNAFTFNKFGLITWNITNNFLAKNDLSPYLKRTIQLESLGIKILKLGGEYENYNGFLKQQLSSDCWWNLYKKNNQTFCRDMSYSSYIFCKTYYNDQYSPVTFKDQKIQDLLNNIRTKNLVMPFGGTWTEITQNIPSRPDWNEGDIQ